MSLLSMAVLRQGRWHGIWQLPEILLVALVQAKGQGHLVQHLTKNVGFGVGLEFRESSSLLNSSNTGTIKAGMTFNLAVGVLLLSMVAH